MQTDQRLQRNKSGLAGRKLIRQPQKPLDFRREAHKRIQALSIAADEIQRKAETKIRDEGEGMRGVDGQRRKDRENMAEEMLIQPHEFGGADRVRLQNFNAFSREQNA